MSLRFEEGQGRWTWNERSPAPTGSCASREHRFDIVYTSGGVLEWLPDIARWGRVAAGFVRPGGFLYLNEIHPVVQALAIEDVTPGELRPAYPYWSHSDPIRFEVQGSYADPDAPTAGLVGHGWNHSLGEIVTALADASLRLEFLHEFDYSRVPVAFLVQGDDRRWRLPGGSSGSLPLSFSLKASKPLDADAERHPRGRR